MTDDIDITVDVVEAADAPMGTPPDFRELVALALKTTDERALQDAEDAYRGIYTSSQEYIARQVAEFLPIELQWLLPCCEPSKLRTGYENGVIVVWEIKLKDGRVLVFESDRAHSPTMPAEGLPGNL